MSLLDFARGIKPLPEKRLTSWAHEENSRQYNNAAMSVLNVLMTDPALNTNEDNVRGMLRGLDAQSRISREKAEKLDAHEQTFMEFIAQLARGNRS